MSFFQVLQSDFLKTKKNSIKEDASHLKSFDVARVRRGTLKQGKGKRKVRKSQTTINIFLIFLNRKIYILWEKIFGKT